MPSGMGFLKLIAILLFREILTVSYIIRKVGEYMKNKAAELGINLVEAGHFFTEQPVTEFFADILMHIDPNMFIETAYSNMIKYI